MKTQNQKNSKGGFALVAVMFIAMIIGLLAAGVMARGTHLALSATRLVVESQNDWYAQSGLEQAAGYFMNGNSGSLNGYGHATVNFSQTVSGSAANTYQATSTATVNGKTVQLTQDFTVSHRCVTNEVNISELTIGLSADNPSNVVFSVGENAVIRALDAETISLLGSLSAGGLELDNIILNMSGFIDGTLTTVNGGSYETNSTSVVDPTPVIEEIRAQMDAYDDLIANTSQVYPVSSSGSGNNAVLSANLNGGTYVLGTSKTTTTTTGSGKNRKTVTTTTIVTGDIQVSANMHISGTGIAIVDGSLIFGNNNWLTVDPGVTLLVKGNMDMNNQNSVTSGTGEIYLGGTLTETKNGTVYDVGGGLLMRGDYISKNNAVFEGFFYTDGTVTLKNGFELIAGIIIAEGLVMEQNADLTLSKAAAPQWFIDLVGSAFGGSSSITYAEPDRHSRQNFTYVETVSGS